MGYPSCWCTSTSSLITEPLTQVIYRAMQTLILLFLSPFQAKILVPRLKDQLQYALSAPACSMPPETEYRQGKSTTRSSACLLHPVVCRPECRYKSEPLSDGGCRGDYPRNAEVKVAQKAIPRAQSPESRAVLYMAAWYLCPCRVPHCKVWCATLEFQSCYAKQTYQWLFGLCARRVPHEK